MAQAKQGPTTLQGPRVLGEEAFARQQAQQRATIGGRTYGPRMMDDDAAETTEPTAEEKAAAEAAAAQAAADEAEKQKAAVEFFGELTVEELAAHLEGAPEDIEVAIKAELKREKPRKGAVEVLLEAEKKGENRAAVTKVLSGVL